METCKLCRLEKTLCQSHIVPEFCYNETYDKKHRMTILQADPNKKSTQQKGYKETYFVLHAREYLINLILISLAIGKNSLFQNLYLINQITSY